MLMPVHLIVWIGLDKGNSLIISWSVQTYHETLLCFPSSMRDVDTLSCLSNLAAVISSHESMSTIIYVSWAQCSVQSCNLNEQVRLSSSNSIVNRVVKSSWCWPYGDTKEQSRLWGHAWLVQVITSLLESTGWLSLPFEKYMKAMWEWLSWRIKRGWCIGLRCGVLKSFDSYNPILRKNFVRKEEDISYPPYSLGKVKIYGVAHYTPHF